MKINLINPTFVLILIPTNVHHFYYHVALLTTCNFCILCMLSYLPFYPRLAGNASIDIL
jgi:hypothetical protein